MLWDTLAPTLRSVRGPLAAGYLYLLALYLGFARHLDDMGDSSSSELSQRVHALLEYLNPTGELAIATAAAYTLGSVSESVIGGVLPQLPLRLSGGRFVLGRLVALEEERVSVLTSLDAKLPSPRVIDGEQEAGSDRRDLGADLLQAERSLDRARFLAAMNDAHYEGIYTRLQMVPPLCVVGAVISRVYDSWWSMGALGVAAALVAQGILDLRQQRYVLHARHADELKLPRGLRQRGHRRNG